MRKSSDIFGVRPSQCATCGVGCGVGWGGRFAVPLSCFCALLAPRLSLSSRDHRVLAPQSTEKKQKRRKRRLDGEDFFLFSFSFSLRANTKQSKAKQSKAKQSKAIGRDGEAEEDERDGAMKWEKGS